MSDLPNTLRMYAEDIHSAVGHSDCSSSMSQAADRIEQLEKENEALKATNDELKQVRCEGCGYLVSEREHLGCHSEKTLKELEAIAEQNVALRSALEQMVASCDKHHCGLKIADDALNLPNLAAEVLKRRDAETVEKCCKAIEGGSFLHDEAPEKMFATEVCKMLRRMSAEIEGDAK